MPEWQAELTGRYREPAEKRLSVCAHALCTYTFNRTRTDRKRTRAPPTLPKHYLTWQIRMCASLPLFDIAGICHISVRASRWFHIETKKPKMNPHVIPLSLSLSVLSSVFLRWVLWNEAGIWSRSQHHMLHNSQSPIVIAEAFIKNSATTSMAWLWMKQGLMVSN